MGGTFGRVVLPIVAGAILGALFPPAGAAIFGLTGAAAGAAIGAIVGAVTVGIGFLAQVLAGSPDTPQATSRTGNVTVNTFTRTGRIPLVYGFRRVGANIVLLGKLEFKLVKSAYDQRSESHLFARFVAAACEGQIRQIVGVTAGGLLIYPEQYTATLGTPTESAVTGFGGFVPPDRVPHYRNLATLNMLADVGFVNEIPPLEIDVLGRDVVRVVEREHDGGFIPTTCSVDGPTNRFWGITSTGRAFVITQQHEGEARAGHDLITMPSAMVGTPTNLWYVGLLDMLVVQDTVSKTTFYRRPRTSPASWQTFEMDAAYARPIISWHLDDRSGRLHTVHQDGSGQYFIRATSLLDLDSEQHVLPIAAPTQILSMAYRAEERRYYFVVKDGGAYFVWAYSPIYQIKDGITQIAGTPLGLSRLGTFIYLWYTTSVVQYNLATGESTNYTVADCMDTDHDLGSAPQIRTVQTCGSRYGAVLLTVGASWRAQLVYGPRRPGATILVPASFRRYIAFAATSGIRIRSDAADVAPLRDTVWATVGPADVARNANSLPTIGRLGSKVGANYLTTWSASAVTTLCSSADLASGYVFAFYWYPTKNVDYKTGMPRILFLRWNPAGSTFTYWFTAYNGEINGNWLAGSGTGGGSYRCIAPERVRRAGYGTDYVADHWMIGRAIKQGLVGSPVAGSLDDPAAAARTIATSASHLNDLNSGDPIYQSPGLVLDSAITTAALAGTDPGGASSPANDAFPPYFPVAQVGDNTDLATATAAAQISGSLSEANTPGLVKAELAMTAAARNRAGIQVTPFSAAFTASWESYTYQAVVGPTETRVPMSLTPTVVRQDYWQGVTTPASESVDLIENTRFGRSADDSEIAWSTWLSLHGYSREQLTTSVTQPTSIVMDQHDDALADWPAKSGSDLRTMFGGVLLCAQRKNSTGENRSIDTTTNASSGAYTGTPIASYLNVVSCNTAGGPWETCINTVGHSTNDMSVELAANGNCSTATTDYEPTNFGPAVRVSDDGREKFLAILGFVDDAPVPQCRLQIWRGRVADGWVKVAESTTTLSTQNGGSASREDGLVIRLVADATKLVATVVWARYTWDDTLTYTSTDLAANTRCGVHFKSNSAVVFTRLVKRLKFTRLLPSGAEVITTLRPESAAGTLRWRLPSGWTGVAYDGDLAVVDGGTSPYTSVVGPQDTVTRGAFAWVDSSVQVVSGPTGSFTYTTGSVHSYAATDFVYFVGQSKDLTAVAASTFTINANLGTISTPVPVIWTGANETLVSPNRPRLSPTAPGSNNDIALLIPTDTPDELPAIDTYWINASSASGAPGETLRDYTFPCFFISSTNTPTATQVNAGNGLTWLLVEYTRALDIQIAERQVAHLTSITISGCRDKHRHVIQTVDFTAGTLGTPVVSMAVAIRWEVAPASSTSAGVTTTGYVVRLIQAGVTLWQSSVFTPVYPSPAGGGATLPLTITTRAGFTTTSAAGLGSGGVDLVYPSYSTRNTPTSETRTIERYNWDHIITSGSKLEDVLPEILTPAFAYDPKRPGQFAVAFETGYAEPIMHFEPSKIFKKDFGLSAVSAGRKPNRVRVLFYNADTNDDDQRTWSDESDIEQNGVRELELRLFCVTNSARALYIARQTGEGPYTDRQVISFFTGLEASALEPGDPISVTHPRRTFTRKLFRVASITNSGKDIEIEAKEVTPYTIDDTQLLGVDTTPQPIYSR